MSNQSPFGDVNYGGSYGIANLGGSSPITAGGLSINPTTTYTYPNTWAPSSGITGIIPMTPYWSMPTPESCFALIPIGDKFLHIKTMITVGADGKQWRLDEILKGCKNIAYVEAQGEYIVSKAVWTAIEAYISASGFAGMSPIEYLDKAFAPETPEVK